MNVGTVCKKKKFFLCFPSIDSYLDTRLCSQCLEIYQSHLDVKMKKKLIEFTMFVPDSFHCLNLCPVYWNYVSHTGKTFSGQKLSPKGALECFIYLFEMSNTILRLQK